MTRKDYVKVAKMICSISREQYDVNTIQHFENELADIFAADSPKFDRERFEKACATEEEK